MIRADLMDYRQRKGMAPCLPGERFYMGHVIINSLKNHVNINYKLPGWSSVPLETEDWEHWRITNMDNRICLYWKAFFKHALEESPPESNRGLIQEGFSFRNSSGDDPQRFFHVKKRTGIVQNGQTCR